MVEEDYLTVDYIGVGNIRRNCTQPDLKPLFVQTLRFNGQCWTLLISVVCEEVHEIHVLLGSVPHVNPTDRNRPVCRAGDSGLYQQVVFSYGG